MSAALRRACMSLLVAVGTGCKDESPADGDERSPGEPVPLSELVPSDGVDVTVEAVGLIPIDAELVIGVDIAALMQRPEWRKTADSDGIPSDFQRACRACDLGPDAWRFAVAGVGATRRHGIVVASAEGLGTRPVLTCLFRELGLPMTVSDDGKRIDADFEGTGIITDDDTIAITSRVWAAHLLALETGESKTVEDGPLRPILARTDRTRPVWFAGLGNMGMGSRKKIADEIELEDAAGWLDVSRGLDGDVSLTVEDPAATRMALQREWRSAISMLTLFGLPQAVIDGVRFSDGEGRVRITAHLDEREAQRVIPSLADKIAERGDD